MLIHSLHGVNLQHKQLNFSILELTLAHEGIILLALPNGNPNA